MTERQDDIGNAYREVWAWVKSLFSFPWYRIRHVDGRGYIAEVFGAIGWQAIDGRGQATVSGDYTLGFPDLWCATEEDAGARINKREDGIGGKVVWKG